MTHQNHPDRIPLAIASLLVPLALGAQTVTPAAPAPTPAAPKSPWATSASLALKESFDSNVYLQNLTPNPASVVSAAVAGFSVVPAKKGSLVSSVLPRFGLDYTPCEAFYGSANYAPELTYYSAASSENFVAQRGTLNFGGKIKEASWDLLNTVSYIDGSDLGPTFGRPGDIPAIGGIPLRDRRDAFIFRNNFRLTYPIGDFFLRPVASTYFHDFQTEQFATPAAAPWVYENYIDRQEVSGGLDVGYQVAEKTRLVLGYRYGSQNQGVLLGKESPYDNSFQRILVGVEGSPADWLKLAVMLGPDFRNFHDKTPTGFDPDEVLCYVDATITVLPTVRDSIVVAVRRSEQPSYASISMYQDIVYSINWRHKLNDAFTAAAGLICYNGEWQEPAVRDDWIFTPSISVAYTYKKFSAELAYLYDWAVSRVPNTEGREYNRNLVSLALKYNF